MIREGACSNSLRGSSQVLKSRSPRPVDLCSLDFSSCCSRGITIRILATVVPIIAVNSGNPRSNLAMTLLSPIRYKRARTRTMSTHRYMPNAIPRARLIAKSLSYTVIRLILSSYRFQYLKVALDISSVARDRQSVDDGLTLETVYMIRTAAVRTVKACIGTQVNITASFPLKAALL